MNFVLLIVLLVVVGWIIRYGGREIERLYIRYKKGRESRGLEIRDSESESVASTRTENSATLFVPEIRSASFLNRKRDDVIR